MARAVPVMLAANSKTAGVRRPSVPIAAGWAPPSMPWSPEVTGDASFTARVARVASYRTLWFLIADR